MATVKETMMMDAARSTETTYMISVGDTFEGEITRGDEDWIRIELTEGKQYTIAVGGDTATGQLNDSVLMLLDSKGGLIDENDDKDGAKGMLGSEITFTPEAGSGTQTYYISVKGYSDNPGAVNTGKYTVSVTEKALPEPGVGAPITGTKGNDKLIGTGNKETIKGLGGDDSLYGGAADDTLEGGDGNDLLTGGPGKDVLSGGADEDTISYRKSAMGVTINLADGAARGGDAEGDTIVDKGISDRIENVIGSMHDDDLVGSSADNKLWGLGGADVLYGGRRADELYGGAGADDLDGGSGDDKLEGGPGADVLTGGEGSDTASYGESAMGVTVRLHAGQAARGDAEGDTWNLSVTQKYRNNDEDEVTTTLADIEHLTGSAHDDVLAGDLRDNTIMGGGGDDKIYGGPDPSDLNNERDDAGITNKDTLHGEAGDDKIYGGPGGDTLMGGEGDDELYGGGGGDKIYGGAGKDILEGGAGEDILEGGAGSDMIHADEDDKVIDGWLSAGNTAEADPGAVDTVSYAKLEEGVTRTLSTDGATTGDGGVKISNVEDIIGSQGDDTITGDGEDNVIEGHEGGDTLAGGGGNDTLSYRHSDDWVRVTLKDNSAAITSRGHASGDTATDFVNVMGSAHDDDLTGDTKDNKLWGLAGDDDIDGAGGDDTVEGGAGADELDGGHTGSSGAVNSEKNTLSYAGSDAGVTVNLSTASAAGGHATGDTIETYEWDHDGISNTDEIDVATFVHVTGSEHNDSLAGDGLDNHLTGSAGDDTLRGLAGADRLIGGPGADMLDGGSSLSAGGNTPNDASDDKQHIDWAVYRDAKAGVTVNLSTGMGEAGEADGDTLLNIELIWGSKKDDIFIASSGADLIHGDSGIDTVSYDASAIGVTVDLNTDNNNEGTNFSGSGTPASPYMSSWNGVGSTPGSGPDISDIDANGVQRILKDPTEDFDEDDNPDTNGATGDRLGSIENLIGSGHKDTLTGDDNPNVLQGGGGDDTLSGGGNNDTIHGDAGDDVIKGDGGDDTLRGFGGDDTISGGAGTDTINGGAGDDTLRGGDSTGNTADSTSDTFVFSPADGAGSDVIADFSANTGEDKIDLSAYKLTAAQVIAAASVRGDSVVINLEAHGGGRITLQDVSLAELLPDGGLSVYKDLNDDGDFADSLDETVDMQDYNGDGDMLDSAVAEGGIFIL